MKHITVEMVRRRSAKGGGLQWVFDTIADLSGEGLQWEEGLQYNSGKHFDRQIRRSSMTS